VNQRVPHIVFRDGERFVTEVDDGTILRFKYFAFKGNQSLGVTYRVTDHDPNATLTVDAGGEAPLAEIPLAEVTEWTTATVNVPFPSGTHPLALTYRGNGTIEIKEIHF
jgi:hypothetical protein